MYAGRPWPWPGSSKGCQRYPSLAFERWWYSAMSFTLQDDPLLPVPVSSQAGKWGRGCEEKPWEEHPYNHVCYHTYIYIYYIYTSILMTLMCMIIYIRYKTSLRHLNTRTRFMWNGTATPVLCCGSKQTLEAWLKWNQRVDYQTYPDIILDCFSRLGYRKTTQHHPVFPFWGVLCFQG